MSREEKEIKTGAVSQTADCVQTEELADLPVTVEQTEEVSGGRSADYQHPDLWKSVWINAPA